MYSQPLFLLSIALSVMSSIALFPKLKGLFNRSINLSNTRSLSSTKYPIYCDESVMSKKAHGTSEKPVMKDLKWGCDWNVADRICNFNRHYAEYAGYWESTNFLDEVCVFTLAYFLNLYTHPI